ncbi:MAG: hypothetical protein P9L97_01955 [Candidatus Tenebribacter davisii]|jgi:hypothetical protein|nr:hypothetical protein [Candidatus Tenebribacter davisii]
MLKQNKSFLFLLIFIFVFTIFTSGCGSSASGEKEPNNSIDKANEITIGNPFSLKINPVKDIDWFKVNLTQQGYLKVQASQIPESLKLEVGYALFQEWEGSKVKWLKKWRKLPDALFIPKAGTYYFAIKDDYDDKESKESIQIKADFIPEFDAGEPNNNPELATAIEFGTTVKPAIFPTGDVDWYKVNVTEQGYILVKSKDVIGDITPEIYFAKYDEWANPKIQRIRNWHKFPDACTVTEPGEYYIYLHDDYDDRSSEMSFSFLVDFLNEVDVNEPNNDFKTAKSISRGDTLKLAVFPQGDLDYYKLKIEAGDKVKFMAKEFTGITPEIRLYTLNENDNLDAASGWNTLPAEITVIPGTEYYLLVHDNYDDNSSKEIFEFRIQ